MVDRVGHQMQYFLKLPIITKFLVVFLLINIRQILYLLSLDLAFPFKIFYYNAFFKAAPPPNYSSSTILTKTRLVSFSIYLELLDKIPIHNDGVHATEILAWIFLCYSLVRLIFCSSRLALVCQVQTQ